MIKMIKSIHHIPVYAEDFEGNLKFLTEVMGFPVVGIPADKNEKVRLLKVGSDIVGLIDAKQYKRRCVCTFLVDNLRKEIKELREKGIDFSEITEVAEYEYKEGKYKYVFLRMRGKEKFNGGWIELVEREGWNP